MLKIFAQETQRRIQIMMADEASKKKMKGRMSKMDEELAELQATMKKQKIIYSRVSPHIYSKTNLQQSRD